MIMNPFGKALVVLSAVIVPVSSIASADKYEYSVVKIPNPGNDKPGTGFILGPDRRNKCVLVTAKHVVQEHIIYKVPVSFVYHDKSTKSIPISSFFFDDDDEGLDLAAAPIQCGKHSLKIPLARSASVSISNSVKIIGYPASLHTNDLTLNRPAYGVRGIITKFSSAGKDADTYGYNISYDAKTEEGFSGGPVLSEDLSKIVAVHGFTFAVQPPKPKTNPDGSTTSILDEMTDEEKRDYLRVGGSGITSAILYKMLRKNGYKMPRAGGTCLVGVC
jgi:hypothetical protein